MFDPDNSLRKAYCGAKEKVPNGKSRGTLKDCIKKGQIRYFGVGKIVTLPEKPKKPKKPAKPKAPRKPRAKPSPKPSPSELKAKAERIKKINFGREIYGLKSEIKYEDNLKKKKVLQKKLAKLRLKE